MQYEVLKAIGHSYVVSETGEPLVTYYSDDTRLFTSKKIANQNIPCFLNIRRPVVIDVLDKNSIKIPSDLPAECDGIIFTNYGSHRIKAFYVRDKKTQVMRIEQNNSQTRPIGAPAVRNATTLERYKVDLIKAVNMLLPSDKKPLHFDDFHWNALEKIYAELENRYHYMGWYRTHHDGPSATIIAFFYKLIAMVLDGSLGYTFDTQFLAYRLIFFLTLIPDLKKIKNSQNHTDYSEAVNIALHVLEIEFKKGHPVPCTVVITKDENNTLSKVFPNYELAFDFIQRKTNNKQDKNVYRAVIWIWGEHGWNYYYGNNDEDAHILF